MIINAINTFVMFVIFTISTQHALIKYNENKKIAFSLMPKYV